MRTTTLIGWASGIGLALLTIYFASSVYFCAESLKGEIGGCAAMAGESVLRSTTAQIAAVAGVADHLQKFWDPRMRSQILAHLDAGGDGLLAVVQVHEAANLAGAVQLGAGVLEGADAQHVPQQAARGVGVGQRLDDLLAQVARTDQGGDRAGRHPEAGPVHGRDAAEPLGQVVHPEKGFSHGSLP